jgi:adenylate cyclase
MEASRQTVLCAAASGELKATGKRAAEGAIADCLDLLRDTAESCGGRVLKTTATCIVALFATPDAAAGAASKMRAAVDALPPLAGAKLGLRLAFHSGPVGTSANDPTVKLVLRLVARAQDGQILTTQRTAELLRTSFRAFSRHLQATPLGDSGAKAQIYEVSLAAHPR